MDRRLGSPPQKLAGGESPMLDFEVGTAVQARFRQGHGTRQMARERGLDRKTVTRVLAQARPAPSRRTGTRPTVGTPSVESLRQRAGEVDDHADRIFPELQARGAPGGDARVQLAVRPLRAERERLAAATRRVDTAPGRPGWMGARRGRRGVGRRCGSRCVCWGWARPGACLSSGPASRRWPR